MIERERERVCVRKRKRKKVDWRKNRLIQLDR